jgi:hypothetical protein
MPTKRKRTAKPVTPETSLAYSEPEQISSSGSMNTWMYISIFIMITSIIYFLFKFYTIRMSKSDKEDGKITQQEFFDILSQQIRSLGPEEKVDDKPTVFMIAKSDCPACAVMYPEVATFSRVIPFLANKPISVLRVMANEHPEIIKETNVDAVPTLCFYNNGKYVKEIDELGLEQWVHFLKQELPDYFEASTTPLNEGDNSSNIERVEELSEVGDGDGDGEADRGSVSSEETDSQ